MHDRDLSEYHIISSRPVADPGFLEGGGGGGGGGGSNNYIRKRGVGTGGGVPHPVTARGSGGAL